MKERCLRLNHDRYRRWRHSDNWIVGVLVVWMTLLGVWLVVRSDGMGGRPFSTAWSYDPALYDPHRTSDPVAYSIFRYVCEPLFYEDFDGQARGLLAADNFEYQDSGRRVIVHLRPDIYFHDGAPVDAYAVQRSFVRLVDYGVSPLSNQFSHVNVVVRDPSTLEFLLPEPNYDFVRLVLSNPYAAIVSAQDKATVAEHGFVSCTGPYKFAPELYRLDERISLIRNDEYRWPPHYFKNRDHAHIHQLDFLFQSGRDERFELLLSDEICGLSLNAEQAKAIAQKREFRTYEATGGVTYLGYNFLKPRWQDVRVRRAIAMAIDKTALSKQGPFVVAQTPFTQATTGYDAGVAKFSLPYDPHQARSLIVEAGFDLNSEIVLLIPESNTYRELASTVERYLNDIGLNNIRIREAPRRKISTQRQDFDLLLFDYAWGDYTALSIFMGSGPHNLLNYSDANVASLIDSAVRTADKRTSHDMIVDAQRIVLEKAVWNPLLIRKIVFAVNSRCVEGERQSPFGELLLHDAHTF